MTGVTRRAGAVPFHKRLYVWSCLLEPLFLFVIFEDSVFGITGNLSRLVQVLTCLLLGWRLLLSLLGRGWESWSVPDRRRPLYRYYPPLFLLPALSGIPRHL